jgi:glycogen(starch) synthase
MRVLFWQELFWPHMGGVEVLATKLLSALQRRGYEIIVVTRQDSPDLPKEANYQGIPVYRYPFWPVLMGGQLTQMIELRAQVAKLKRAFAPDLVHINSFGPSAMLHCDTASAHSAPLLVTLHTIHPPINAGSLGRDGLFGRTLRTANWVTCVSNAVFVHWCRLVPEISACSSVVYNGLVPPALCPEPLPTDPLRLLCLGRLHPDKGFDLALKAFAQVVDHFPNANLIIAGDGEERPVLEDHVAELGLKNVVEFIGWVTPDKAFELMNAATVVVMPSRSEGLPTVALEAGLMARPVVATRVGGVPEIVVEQETGLLVDTGDWRALAEAIEFLLAHPEVATQLGQAARRRIKTLFSFERYVDAYDALYRKLVTGDSAETATLS